MFHLCRTLLFAGVLLHCLPCWGVIVFKKGQDEPIRGFLIKENTISIEVHEPLPNGKLLEHVLPRVAIEDIIRAVDVDRLAKLDPETPEGYRSYAEDLAAKTEDPEARYTAIRLYLIAAYLRSEELGRSCLLGMAGLARSSDEERAFRAMAFSLDPDHDRSLLKSPSMATTDIGIGIEQKDRKSLTVALRLLRTGKVREANRYFSRAPVMNAAKQYFHIVSEEEYKEAIGAVGRLTPRLLRKFLALELELSASTPNKSTDEPALIAPWSQLIARDDTQPITPQSLTAITEFDPRLAIYREGKWVAK
jgi:hypothetical protein